MERQESSALEEEWDQKRIPEQKQKAQARAVSQSVRLSERGGHECLDGEGERELNRR